MSDSGSSNGSHEEGEEDVEKTSAEPLATTRSRRSNAGNLMSKLIQDEEDEFYTNVYGGFQEEEDDEDFDDDEGDEDDVDSDFSIDETDEILPEHQLVEEEPKKKAKGYKDPRPKGVATKTSAGPRVRPTSSHGGMLATERSFRDSTRKKSEETMQNIKSGTKRKKIRNIKTWKPLTQEEMLAEAKLTEEENLKSLEVYQKLESEKLKSIKQVKKSIPLPYVSYLSTTMPILDTKERYSRNFLTFVT